MNEGKMTKVRSSNTLDDETDKIIGNPSSWNEYLGISNHNEKITNNKSAKSSSAKLTNMQQKSSWNHTNWNKVEEHVNRLQIRITKAIIQEKWNLVNLTMSHYKIDRHH
jgi:hypothetical protein